MQPPDQVPTSTEKRRGYDWKSTCGQTVNTTGSRARFFIANFPDAGSCAGEFQSTLNLQPSTNTELTRINLRCHYHRLSDSFRTIFPPHRKNCLRRQGPAVARSRNLPPPFRTARDTMERRRPEGLAHPRPSVLCRRPVAGTLT